MIVVVGPFHGSNMSEYSCVGGGSGVPCLVEMGPRGSCGESLIIRARSVRVGQHVWAELKELDKKTSHDAEKTPHAGRR